MWEERYSTPDYVFGKDPAQFLTEHMHLLHAGQTALCVADGEGRNSVFLAQQGLQVTALEYAPSAIAKAQDLAKAAGVSIDIQEADVLRHDWADQYDAVLGIFIQFAGPEEREQLFTGMKRSVRPGGLMLLHGYTPEQIAYGTGGPPHAENMYTTGQLATDFDGWDILENRAYERDVQEGRGHSGHSALIDFVARKPAR
ncbi:MAG: class I SAM-dependent methyltransferase [Sediminimonas sp.]|uniref:SAM-dependent methyltransferase n=1 Tax=Sediminimonas sp. TaxID=2823379 RepID=UPI0028709446|nr:class I SAM-dependent methyltransferase [Sediminimonas sp.]MDR9485501.1 class I SAM-dependent methyltransferase [Sediminimonas sp.]